jgi:hypothetical protein
MPIVPRDGYWLSLKICIGFGASIFFFMTLFYGAAYAIQTYFNIRKGRRDKKLPTVAAFAVGIVATCLGCFVGGYVKARLLGQEMELESLLVTSMTGIFIALGFLFHNLYKTTREKAEKLEAKNTEAELHAFKNQMQPHFLFNSLNSLMALIETNSEQAPVMTQKLADLYREILNNSSRHLSSLQSELAIIEKYLSLERFRFGSRLDYNLNAPAEASEIYLPPLILQTLVENSIKHGISREVGGGRVSVDVVPENGGYRAAVHNPGRIQNASSSGGLGLANSKARLDLLYGEKHGLKIEATPTGVETSFWFSGENRT